MTIKEEGSQPKFDDNFIKTILQDLLELFEDKDTISYKLISNNYGIPIDLSKRILHLFIKQLENNSSGSRNFTIRYVVGGELLENSQVHIALVESLELDEKLKTFQTVGFCHVYSVQPLKFSEDISFAFKINNENLLRVSPVSCDFLPAFKKNETLKSTEARTPSELFEKKNVPDQQESLLVEKENGTTKRVLGPTKKKEDKRSLMESSINSGSSNYLEIIKKINSIGDEESDEDNNINNEISINSDSKQINNNMIYKSKSEINNKCKEIDNNNEISNTNDGINNYKHPSKKSFEKNQTETDPPPSVDLNKKFSLAQKEIVHRTVSSDGYLVTEKILVDDENPNLARSEDIVFAAPKQKYQQLAENFKRKKSKGNQKTLNCFFGKS